MASTAICIGMHFDKPVYIAEKSLITIVKTGEYGRPFRLEMLDGTLLMERVLAPGTAVVMTLEANLKPSTASRPLGTRARLARLYFARSRTEWVWQGSRASLLSSMRVRNERLRMRERGGDCPVDFKN